MEDTKKLGLKYNRKMLIACGDGLNDISMIEYAGIGLDLGSTSIRERV